MVQGSFELSDNSSIKIKGKSFNLNSFKSLNDILQKLTYENKTKNISVIGNFNTELQLNSIFSKVNEIDEALSLLQHITRTIQESSIKFIFFKRAKMNSKDIDLFEVNEAFAAVVLRYLEALNISEDKVNVNGVRD